MGKTTSVQVRRLLYVLVGAAIALAPAMGFGGSHEAVLAACNDVVDTTDSFSMDCAPTLIPDTSDQLTEAEVAEPGWNATPGGHGPTGHGGHG